MFKELRVLEPHQVRGMETYSTVLFHLQKEVAMSTLAQDMVAIDKTSAEVCHEKMIKVNQIGFWSELVHSEQLCYPNLDISSIHCGIKILCLLR